jgi:hypothetical protein
MVDVDYNVSSHIFLLGTEETPSPAKTAGKVKQPLVHEIQDKGRLISFYFLLLHDGFRL